MSTPLHYLLLITAIPFSNNDPLRPALRAPGCEVKIVKNCREARREMWTGEPIDVIVCDITLPDGNWSDVMRDVVQSGSGASVVLRTAGADARLWSEALWRGAYDLLVEPYSKEEAQRTLEGAARATQLLDDVRRPAPAALQPVPSRFSPSSGLLADDLEPALECGTYLPRPFDPGRAVGKLVSKSHQFADNDSAVAMTRPEPGPPDVQ